MITSNFQVLSSPESSHHNPWQQQQIKCQAIKQNSCEFVSIPTSIDSAENAWIRSVVEHSAHQQARKDKDARLV
jgi:hypothetical protein